MGAQIGVNDGMMGMAQGANEASGTVFQRNTQGELATIQYSDNLEQSMTAQFIELYFNYFLMWVTPHKKHAIRDEKGNRRIPRLLDL